MPSRALLIITSYSNITIYHYRSIASLEARLDSNPQTRWPTFHNDETPQRKPPPLDRSHYSPVSSYCIRQRPEQKRMRDPETRKVICASPYPIIGTGIDSFLVSTCFFRIPLSFSYPLVPPPFEKLPHPVECAFSSHWNCLFFSSSFPLSFLTHVNFLWLSLHFHYSWEPQNTRIPPLRASMQIVHNILLYEKEGQGKS